MTTPELVDIDTVTGLSVTGVGAPGEESHVDNTKVLYQVAGAVIALAAEQGVPVSMPPLEGFWWVEDDRPPFEVPRQEWHWRLFLRMPDGIDPAWVEQARDRAPRLAARVALTTVHEGRCVQATHHGPYADEPRTLSTMDKFMAEAGLVRRGLHHEIYLTDFQVTPPELATTILRQPVRAA